MIHLLALLLWFVPQSAPFTHMTYCKESSRGAYENQCVSLDSAGKGEVRFKRRGADEIRADLVLSDAGRQRFLAVLAATHYLEGGDSWESGKKVADLGRKTITLDMPTGQRQAEYNFSTRKEVTDLGNFFDGLINQETIAFDIDTAMQFDRLSIPKRLDQIDADLKFDRIGDPDAFIPVLDKIANDARIMNFARDHAAKLKEQIRAHKSKG